MQKLVILLRPARFTIYREGGSARVYERGSNGQTDGKIPRVLMVRPADCWFGTPIGDVPFGELLDPDRGFQNISELRVAGSVPELLVTPVADGGDMWTVTARIDTPVRVLSVAHPGRPPVYEAVWGVTGNERRLKSLRTASDRLARGIRTTETFKLIVEDSTPEPPGVALAGRHLTLAALRLPAGTSVQFHSDLGRPVRTETVGGRPAAEQDELDALTELLKAGEFAGGKRGPE